MSVSPEDIATSRALRDEARATVTVHLAQIRADLSAESIGQRIKHKASTEAADAIASTRAVAADNRLVIGATAAGLVGWFARRPLIALGRKVAGSWRVERLWPWRRD